MKTLAELALDSCDRAIFSSEDGGPFQAHLTQGVSNLVLVTGSNASGKSVFFRVLASLAKAEENATGITLSIRERTGSGLHEMASMRRAMMYGEEGEQSTGACSVHTAENGFGNARRYAEEGKRVVLMLDEPEMGLSEDYTSAMGQWLAQQAKAMTHKNELGLVVVTHSRALVKRLVEELGQNPTFVNTDSPQSVGQWLEQVPKRTVEDLLALDKLGTTRWRAMQDFINERPARRAKEEAEAAESAPTQPAPRPRR